MVGFLSTLHTLGPPSQACLGVLQTAPDFRGGLPRSRRTRGLRGLPWWRACTRWAVTWVWVQWFQLVVSVGVAPPLGPSWAPGVARGFSTMPNPMVKVRFENSKVKAPNPLAPPWAPCAFWGITSDFRAARVYRLAALATQGEGFHALPALDPAECDVFEHLSPPHQGACHPPPRVTG